MVKNLSFPTFLQAKQLGELHRRLTHHTVHLTGGRKLEAELGFEVDVLPWF